jgi:hypothetical protein
VRVLASYSQYWFQSMYKNAAEFMIA